MAIINPTPNQTPPKLQNNTEEFVQDVFDQAEPDIVDESTLDLEEDPVVIDESQDNIEDEQLAFRPPKKPTLRGKKDEDLSNEELRLKQQEELQPEIKKDFIVEEDTGNVIFKDFSEDEVKSVNNFFDDVGMSDIDGTQTKSLQTLFNSIDEAMGTQGFSDAINKTFAKQLDEIATSSKMTVDEMMKQAASIGRNDVYQYMLRNKPPYDNKMLLRGIVETKLLYTRLSALAKEAIQGKGNISKEKQLHFYQTLRLFGTMYSRTAGDVTMSARKLASLKYVDKPDTDFSEDFVEFLGKQARLGDSKEFFQIASSFLSLKPYQAGKFANDGFVKRLGDAWSEVWVNSLLSSPITHVVNNVANFGFNVLRVGEQAVAASINKIPGLSAKDGVQFNEVLATIRAIKQGHRLGTANMKNAFNTGDAATTKLDLRRPNAFGKRLLPEKYRDNFVGTALEYMGSYFRLPGRFLVAEDEYAKGILYKMEIYKIAQKNANEVLNNGGTKEAAQDAYTKTVTNPNNDTVNLAKQNMEEGTFQGDLPDGILKKIQSSINHPTMRVFVPFYKTITNIFLETSKRNPALAAFMPSVYKDIAKPGAARQLALAKLSVGTTLMYNFGSFAYGANINDDVFITGHAPYNRAERDAFFRKGMLPYSFNIKQKDGNYKAVSYARFEPISALLAISADTAYAMSRPDQFGDSTNSANMLNLASSSLEAIYPYISSQPFMTAVSELGKTLESSGANDPSGVGARILAQLTEQVGRATVGVFMEAGPTGTFNNYLTKMQDATIYDKTFTEDQRESAKDNMFFSLFIDEEQYELPLAIRKFYQVYNNATIRSPFYNNNLKPRLNLWGEDMKGPEGGVISPFKVQNERYNKVDDKLLQLGLGLSMPRATIAGIALSSDQYHDYLTFLNDDSKDMGNITMLDEMEEEIDRKGFDDLLPKDQIDDLNSILSDRKSVAKQMILEKYPELNARIEEIKEQIMLRGRRE